MNTNSMLSIVDILVIGCGMYVIYLCLEMKKTGKIKANMLLPKGLDPKRCKDPAGYIKTIGIKQLLLGVLAFGCGLAGLLQDYGGYVNSVVYLSCLLVFFIYAIWYAVYIKKVIRKFW